MQYNKHLEYSHCLHKIFSLFSLEYQWVYLVISKSIWYHNFFDKILISNIFSLTIDLSYLWQWI